jgi:hypothetical protein
MLLLEAYSGSGGLRADFPSFGQSAEQPFRFGERRVALFRVGFDQQCLDIGI